MLGPESAISDKALKELGDATRVGAEDPVDNAIEFARFTDGDFGWNINDPGHGFAIANIDRPLDAAAAAPLAATGGSPGPLLLTDDAASVPPALESFLSDTQPGLRGRPDARRLQPRLDHRQHRRDVDRRSRRRSTSSPSSPRSATRRRRPDVTPPGGGGTTDATTTIPDLGDLGGATSTTDTTSTGTTTTTPDLGGGSGRPSSAPTRASSEPAG